MKIYTKTGDGGSTGLLGGRRVPKDALRIEAYGTVDELNAVIGLARSEPGVDAGLADVLARIQEDLFALGAALASEPGRAPRPGEGVGPAQIEARISDGQVLLAHGLVTIANPAPLIRMSLHGQQAWGLESART